MVAVWVDGVPSVAFVGVPRVTTTVSFGSSSASAVMVMVMVAVVEPAGIVSGLAVIEQSLADAVPLTVNGAVTSKDDAAESCAVIVIVPDSPALLCEAAVNDTVGAASSSVMVA